MSYVVRDTSFIVLCTLKYVFKYYRVNEIVLLDKNIPHGHAKYYNIMLMILNISNVNRIL